MLIAFVCAYLALTIAIGLVAARRVKSSKDYLVAGRALPLYMNIATVFATWFGAETVLSISATFAKDGLAGVPGDPFGATTCLVLAALLFARLFYRMNLLTIGDFYKHRYGKGIEVLTSLSITISYLGWTSAQMTALGLVISTLSDGALALDHSILAGAAVVLVYTIFGGMWSVAFTDLLQTVVILIGLTLVAFLTSDMAGGFDKVIEQAAHDGKFAMLPSDSAGWWAMAGAFFAFAFGSIPQQDVFQRMTSAKSENDAVRGTVIGGLVYFGFAFVPMFIAYAALVAHPEMKDLFAAEDPRAIQQILPNLVLGKMPAWAQVLFFGALLSAILSTASGALLAPTALFTENVLRPFAPRLGDKQFLLLLRVVLVTFTASALVFALNSAYTMYEMVQNAYNVTLVGAFVPLLCGAYWKRANTQGALLSVVMGIGTWIGVETLVEPLRIAQGFLQSPYDMLSMAAAFDGVLIGTHSPTTAVGVAVGCMYEEFTIPSNLLGLGASIVGMLMGTLAPQIVRNAGHSIDATIHHAKAAAHKHDHGHGHGHGHTHGH